MCERPTSSRFRFPQTPHLARVIRTDGDAELSLDEGVVDQVSHVFERLPIVFTDTETKVQLDHSCDNSFTAPRRFSVPTTSRRSSPPVEVRLAEAHHEQRHLKGRQDQQHLGDQSGDETTSVQQFGLY